MEEFYSVEQLGEKVEEYFDIKFEFDAPQCYDFNRPETGWEAQEAELWFDSAGNYPPSPFVLKLNWKFDINADDGEYGDDSNSADYDGDEEVCNCCNEEKLRAKAKSSINRSSTLMKATASYLAKQNKYRPVKSNQFQRHQRILDKLDDKSSKSNEGNATKRQKLEAGYLCKVAHLTHQAHFMHKKPKGVQSVDGYSVQAKSKVTVPKEPELQTARRAQRRRSKIEAESDEKAKPHPHLFKALPLNRKILEAPSLPFPKKSLPQPPEFQLFHLRTPERARRHACCTNAMKVPNYVSTSRTENTGRLRSFKSIDSLKVEKCEAINKHKASPLNKKIISSEGETGVLQNTKKEITSPREFKCLADRRLPDEPLIELLNKLSLSSEVHDEKYGANIVSEVFKQNEPVAFLQQCQIMNVDKENFTKGWQVGISV